MINLSFGKSKSVGVNMLGNIINVIIPYFDSLNLIKCLLNKDDVIALAIPFFKIVEAVFVLLQPSQDAFHFLGFSFLQKGPPPPFAHYDQIRRPRYCLLQSFQNL